ncbi:hypothetical protein BDZ88DRAFT_427926 [Geranomyces variabilis]|nr:hypothetical protein BDZ88DRAFT_427926 [Geranomyces variabilis]KAJ3136085.1 hypothetical protein HDU90_003488 [Geranomyces variabilis]
MSAIHGRGGLMPPIPSFLAKDTSTAALKQPPPPLPSSHPQPSTVLPQKLGIRYGIPALVLFYVAKDSGKTRQRSMPLRKADRLTAGEIVTALRDRHAKYLRSVKVEQLKRLVELIQKHAKDPKATSIAMPAPKQAGKPVQETLVKETAGAPPPPLPKPSALLPLAGKRPDEDIAAAKTYASVAATSTPAVSVARPVTDVAHKPPAVDAVAASQNAALGADWNAPQKMPAVLAPLPAVKATLPSIAAPVVDGTKDLNKVSEDELKRAKQAMNADFEKNHLKPGDKGFAYDVQKSFGPPTDPNDWDEDSDISPPRPANPTTTQPRKNTDSLDELSDDMSPDALAKTRNQPPTTNAASASAKAWLRSTPAPTDDKNSSVGGTREAKGAWAADENSIDDLLLSDDEDVGVEAEIQRIEREERGAAVGGGKNRMNDQDAEDEGSTVEQSVAVDRTSWQPPSVTATAGPGMSKLAPLGGPSGAGFPPQTAVSGGGLAPIRTVPALEKPGNDEITSPANPGKLVTVPVVSTTTPAPVSALTTLGGDDAAGSNDRGDEISEEIEEYILESDGDGDDDEDEHHGIIPPAAVNLSKAEPAPAAKAAIPPMSSSLLGGLPPLQGITTVKPAGKAPQESLQSHEDEANDEYDDEDFGAGHTDDEVAAEEEDEDDKILVDDGSGDDDDDAEIVFSDDGLSYDEKDDDGGF